MRGSRLWKLVAVLLATALVLSACGDDDDDEDVADTGDRAAKRTIALAFVGPLTGPNANLGINIRDGAKLAIREANVDSEDYDFVLKEYDTQGDPAQAPGQKDKYIPDREIVGVIGPTFSGETKAVLPDLDRAGLVMVSASATNVDLPNVVPNTKVFHRLIPDDAVQAKGVADYIQRKIVAEKVGLLHDNTEYGKGLFQGVLDLLKAAGINTAVTDAIDPKATDYSAAVNKVKAADIDVLFYGGYYAEAGRLKKQLTDANVDAVFVSGDGSLDPGFIEAAGAAGAEGAQITCPCRLATEDAGGKVGTFATDYEGLIGGKSPGTYSAEGYDAAKILIDGIEAGNNTRPKLLDYVENLSSYDGISKVIDFETNGNVKAGAVYVYGVKAGKLTELGTTAELTK